MNIANGARMIAALEVVLTEIKTHNIPPEDIERARREIREQAASASVPEFVAGLGNLRALLEDFLTRAPLEVMVIELPKVAQA